MKKSKFALMCLALGFATASCENELENLGLQSTSQSQNVGVASTSGQDIPQILALKTPTGFTPLGENLRNLLVNKAVSPSECGPTEFVAVQNRQLTPLLNNLFSLFGTQYASIFYLYMDLNLYSAYFDTSAKQYFGKSGEYTNLVAKRKRDLEAFWDMPNQIQINGQHTATLNDREKLADVYEIVGANVNTREDAYRAADQILALNALSPYLPESPFFAIDGFATTYRNLIVIGDGLVELLTETGLEADIVWTGILAHEWAHQIQFKNMGAWYPGGAAKDPVEATRYTELEADFMAAYYMTHKRGATFNSKRVEQFFSLFFQIGDCSFASSGHHGTPAQRMAAARLGFELADQAQKQGHILTPQQAHEVFVSRIGTVL
ncbi:hypothetical protein [Rufibacter psychrotolerans]|uniref:hypothetical protein n=1 Tax=Rufibacter psychrotolerans TaxID=2812556 RepID=UPI00196829AD|nr:hypothetical protein [Rufibacter sp. SYSU D00308]